MRNFDGIKEIGALYYKSNFMGLRVVFVYEGRKCIGDIGTEDLKQRLSTTEIVRVVRDIRRIDTVYADGALITKVEIVNNKRVKQIEDRVMLDSVCNELKKMAKGNRGRKAIMCAM